MDRMDRVAGLTGAEVKRRVEASLRRHGWGNGLRKAADIAARAGLPKRRLYSYTDPGGNSPTLPDFLRLAGALPEGFVNDVLAVVGLGGAHRLSGDGPEACPARTLSAMAARMAMLARHLEDGQQTHTEALEALPEMVELHAKLGRYILALRERVAAL